MNENNQNEQPKERENELQRNNPQEKEKEKIETILTSFSLNPFSFFRNSIDFDDTNNFNQLDENTDENEEEVFGFQSFEFQQQNNNNNNNNNINNNQINKSFEFPKNETQPLTEDIEYNQNEHQNELLNNDNEEEFFYAPTPQCSVTSSFSSLLTFPDNPKSVKECYGKTNTNIPFRKTNEDSYCGFDPLISFTKNSIDHHIGFYAIFDGHNGDECSQLCSKLISDIVIDELYSFYQLSNGDNINNINELTTSIDFNIQHQKSTQIEKTNEKETIIKTKEEKENEIKEMMKRIMNKLDIKIKEEITKDSGSCVICCLVDKTPTSTTIIMSNVGDSNGYIINSETEKKEKLSKEHRIETYEGEKERIEKAGGYIGKNGRVNEIIMVTRAIGDYQLKDIIINEPYTRIIENKENEYEYIIMGSDGLTDYLDEDSIRKEIIRYKEEGIRKEEWCNEFIFKAISDGSTDNISVIILSLC